MSGLLDYARSWLALKPVDPNFNPTQYAKGVPPVSLAQFDATRQMVKVCVGSSAFYDPLTLQEKALLMRLESMASECQRRIMRGESCNLSTLDNLSEEHQSRLNEQPLDQAEKWNMYGHHFVPEVRVLREFRQRHDQWANFVRMEIRYKDGVDGMEHPVSRDRSCEHLCEIRVEATLNPLE